MANVPYDVVPTTQPTAAPPNVSQRPGVVRGVGDVADAASRATGRQTAEGLSAFGRGASEAGDFFGRVAADDASNKYQEGVNRILYGDPNKQVPGPDGKMMPDTGFMGLKGENALRARQDVDKSIQDLHKSLRGPLASLKSDLEFDNMTRRYKAITDAQVGNHARTQQNVWAISVNDAEAKLAVDDIARFADDPERAAVAEAKLVGARIKNAEIAGGGPELVREAYSRGRREALSTRLDVIATHDPARAMRMLEKNKEIVGAQYDNLYNRFRARADKQIGEESADRILAPPAGSVPVESLKGAIIGQESGGRHTKPDGTLLTSVDNAQGIGQIIPDTFRRFAKPGERIENKEDNQRVSNRIVDHYYQQYDGDIRRVAVAYFSGEGNVAPAGSPTPWLRNSKDGNGETVAGYVSGVVARTGGRPSERNQAQVLDEVDKEFADNPGARVAAANRVNESYRRQQQQQVRTRTVFETQVKDNVAEALNVGAPSNPLDERQFVQQYGDLTGPVKYQEYVAKVQFGADSKSFETMTPQEIQTTITERENSAQPGTPGYAARLDRVKGMRKAAKAIDDERREDPAGSVSRDAAVREAEATYDPKKPETFEAVATARMVAQENRGIEPEYRSPITKPEALQYMKPVQEALPGMKAQALEQTAAKFRTMFGDNAPRAFIYGLRAIKLTGELDVQVASGLIDNLIKGKPITEQEVRAAREEQQGAQIEAALRAQPSAVPAADWMSRVTGADAGLPPAPDPGKKPIPNQKALVDLRDNPQSSGEFDKVYGPGTAKKLMETYPFYFQKRAR